MANLKEIRIRIASVSSTKQITSAMKMVSAAKLKKAQDTITRLRPYATKIKEITSNVSENVDASVSPFTGKRNGDNKLIVLITSNKGLCGAFNSNVIKKSISLINESNKPIDVLCIGKRGYETLKAKKYNVISEFNHCVDKISVEKTNEVAEVLMNMFASNRYAEIVLVYNQFKNAASQNIVAEQFLPMTLEKSSKRSKKKNDYIFEPEEDEILKHLIPYALKMQLYKAVIDSVAAEHGARMTAMHQATDNASEMITSLKLQYNKARQSSITKEILEIVSGAEALKG